MAKEMIALIPDSGAVIAVITNEIGRSVKEGIKERRGAALARRCKTIAVSSAGDCDKLLGLRGQIVIDSSVVANVKPETLIRLERVVADIRAANPA